MASDRISGKETLRREAARVTEMAQPEHIRLFLEPRYQKNQNRTANTAANQSKGQCGSCIFGNLMGSDSDMEMLLPLILLLLMDGGDMTLIFALIYILM